MTRLRADGDVGCGNGNTASVGMWGGVVGGACGEGLGRGGGGGVPAAHGGGSLQLRRCATHAHSQGRPSLPPPHPRSWG